MAGRPSDPDEVADELDKFVERLALRLARTFVREVRDRNPVDTGHSRANWIATAGSPNSSVYGIRSHLPGSVDDSRPDAAMRLLESSWKLEAGNIYVTNNVDYVPRLNAQHPTARGYVAISVQVAMLVGVYATTARGP